MIKTPIEDIKGTIEADLRVNSNLIKEYKNKIIHFSKCEDIRSLKISVGFLEEYLIQRDLMERYLKSIDRSIKQYQEEDELNYELSMMEAPYPNNRPIEVQV